MSAKTFGGTTAFLFGVGGTIANCAVQSWKNKSTAANQANVESENGNEIERRRDDIHDEGTIELKYKLAFPIPVATDTISWMGFTWEVDVVNRSDANKTHRIASLDIKKSQYIDSSVSTIVTTD